MQFQFGPQVRTTFKVAGDKGQYVAIVPGQVKSLAGLRTRQVKVKAKLNDGTEVCRTISGKVLAEFLRSRKGEA